MCDKLGGVAIAVQGALFEHNERRQLGDGAFIDIRSGWLTGGEELLDALLSTVPWRAERRQMYDRVVDVPRLVSFHDLTIEDPPHPQLARMRRRLNDIYGGELGEPFTTAGCATTATALTASPGMATPLVAAALRTLWWRSSASAPPASSRCGRVAAVHRCDCRWRMAIYW